jgi:hypothetical protein
VDDKSYGPGQHIEELGLDPEFKVEEGRVEPKAPVERLAEASERQRAIQEQRRKKREEAAQARGGRVVADHGDAEEEDDIVRLHLNQPNLWGPRL